MDNFNLEGFDLFGNKISTAASKVSSRFTIPPFSIMDTRSGEWQERKRLWLSYGIKSDLGREDGLTYNGKASSLDYYREREGKVKKSKEQGTSIFDPVCAELLYQWFCPSNGIILDPFCGGSVRGVVAGLLGCDYWGCDIRQEQIDENIKQSREIGSSKKTTYICGDSINELESAPYADFIFSCPPYGDLEKYSNDPKDLSNMEWHTFIAAYKRIIFKSISKLNNHSFAAFVVGDFRDKKGFYRNFVSETIEAFSLSGAKLYNEAILITPVASASMRVSKQFTSGRKMAKTHQNVLVFCKGDWKKASEKCRKKQENAA